nr:glycosyltransferase [Odontosoria chusana]
MATTTSTSTKHQQHHVVAVAVPAQGHLTPVMRFCNLLAKQDNLIVTFVDFDPIHQRLEELHNLHPPPAAAAACESQPSIRRVHIPIHGLDISKNFSVSFQAFFEALRSIAPYLEQLILDLNRDGPTVTCLLSDFFITLPTQQVADKLGIPRIVQYPCCASRLLLMHYLMEEVHFSIQEVITAVATTGLESEEVFCEGLPGLPTLFNKDIPHFKHVTDDTLFCWKLATQGWHLCNTRAHAVVVNSFEELEASTFATLSQCCNVPIYDVGLWTEPLSEEMATNLWKEDKTCMTWLDRQPVSSVLYISFGSITLMSEAQYSELVDGLLLSEQRFLWVFRPGLVESIDYSASVAEIMSRSEGRGLIINWAPQLQVLEHRSVGGFLTHCGWNSTSESIAHGVPMLCWPYFADQPLNARLIVDVWQVGLSIMQGCSRGKHSLIERGEIERVIRALMEGEEGNVVRDNAKKLMGKSSQCLQKNGSSHIKLKALVASLF